MTVRIYLSYVIKVSFESHFWRKKVKNIHVDIAKLLWKSSYNVSRKSVNHKWFIDFMHGVIVLPDAMSYDKNVLFFILFLFFSSSKLSEVSLPVLFSGCCLLSPFQLSPSASAAVSVAARTVEGPRVDMTQKGPPVCGWCVLHFYWYLPHWCCKLVVTVTNWIEKFISQELIHSLLASFVCWA